MVIQQGNDYYILTVKIEDTEESDKRLQAIITDVHQYLYCFGHSWLYQHFSIGKSHFQRCCRSWIYVSNHLEKFLFYPKNNYTMLAQVLEQEKRKFSKRSFYGKKLRALSNLIAEGPRFNIIINQNG